MRVLLAMLGARRRYILPEVMEELGVLACFVTDIYVGRYPLLPAVLRSLGRGLNLKRFRALADRSSAQIPTSRIVAFQWLGVRYAIARHFAGSADGRLFASVNRRFCARATRYLSGSDICWAYNGAAKELFEAARARNMRCVLEQVIAPPSEERREVEQAEKDWPSWRARMPSGDASQAGDVGHATAADLDSLSRREQVEWRLADAIVVGSRYVQDCLAKVGVAKDRCIVVPSGIDLDAFAVGADARANGRLRVLFVGQINLRKGAPYLLEAVRRLNSRNIELRMVGGVQARRDLVNPYAEWARFTGPVPSSEITAQYHWADVLVVPSVCEGSAMVTYEARSCGLPIVATPNAGAAFTPGVDGLEIPVRDVDAIAATLDHLARDRQELRRLRDGAIANRDALGRDAYRERIRHVLETVAGGPLREERPGRLRVAVVREGEYGA